MALTPEIVRALREPFQAEIIGWKIQANPREAGKKALVVAYIDARAVAERLDGVTNGDWSDHYTAPAAIAGDHISLLCSLTVCGVTRSDVGTVSRPGKGGDATKDLHSDAFKRAAVKFGIGSHLYRFPTVFADVTATQRGTTTFYNLTPAAEQQLAHLTGLLLTNQPIPQHGFSALSIRGSAFGAGGMVDVPAEAALEATTETQPKAASRRTSRPPEATNGHTNGHAAGAQAEPTRTAPPPEQLARARKALAEAQAATSSTGGGATDKQRRLIQRLIGNLQVDDATIQGLIDTFGQRLKMDVTHLFDDPDAIMELEVSVPQASWMIDNLRALG